MENTPKIRFDGFNDAWEQRKLNNVADVRDGTHASPKYLESGHPFITSKNVKNGYINYEEIQYISDEDFEEINKRSKVDVNDILMGMIGTIGNLALIRETPDFAIKNVALIKDIGDIFYLYLYHCLQSKNILNQLSENMDGGTQKFVALKSIRELNISFPSQEEQVLLGKYFENVDNLITLHQRKCDNLKTFKKYLLTKMFPQNGSSIPEIRFDGFTDSWEQRKFSDFTYSVGKRNKENHDLEPYAITNEHGFIPQKEAHDDFGYMKDTDKKAYKIVEPNSFAYNPARINVGSIGYYKGDKNVIVSSLYEIFQTDNYVNDRFLWHWFKSNEFPKWIERFQEGSVRLYFYYDKLCECQMQIPSIQEQKIIADYLDSLDNLITLHQRKCDELKEIKKFMLKNMFV